MHLLATKAGTPASKSAIWRVSVVVNFCLFVLLLWQTAALDVYVSPYPPSDDWYGILLIGNFVFHGFTSIGISIMFMLRIKVFYSPKSAVFRSMLFFGALFIVFNTAGDVYGVLSGINEMNHNYLMIDFDPVFASCKSALAVGLCFEVVFTAIGSVAFLYAIGKGQGRSKSEIVKTVLSKDGLNLITILLINVAIAILGVNSVFYGFNWVNRNCLYLASWAYGLQFRTFVQDSYISAKKMVEENSTRLNGSSFGKSSSNTV